ncbi:MAG: hypothetical protein ACKN83_09090 [Vulcanococcus sp.]
MANRIEGELYEARDPSTSPERLRLLSDRKRRHERDQLRQIIATNPNVDEDLLLELAADYPKEVISNPSFQLLQLSGDAWWETCDLRSLCSLALASGKEAPPFLKPALKSLIQNIYCEYSEMVSLEWQEEWRYGRSVDILANELDGLPTFDISLDIELCSLMEGEHSPWLELSDRAVSFSSDWICALLSSLRSKSIESLFDAFGQDPVEHFDGVTDVIDESVELSSSNEELIIEGISVLQRETRQELFRAHVFYQCHFDEEPEPRFEDGVLHIAVSKHVGGDYVAVSRGSSDDLGQLEPLWGWEPAFLAPEIPEATWEAWLAAWMMS